MRQRILLVDDEPANLTLLEHVLRPFECELIRASGGEEALAKLETHPVDLALLDLMMPKMDGVELLQRIRARKDWSWFPVIFVTAAYEREARLRGLEAGADEFVEKPVDRALLVARVRTLLSLRQAREHLAERAKALEELHHERRELMNFIVHDLKNPLSIIHTNLFYVRNMSAPLSEDAQEALQDAADASDRMKGLVLDLLNVERMEQSALPVQRRPTNLSTLVTEVARSHQREAQLRGLQMSLAVADTTVSADSDLVRRVVENLVENALRHTPRSGAVELRVEQDNEASVIVSNTGDPIPPGLRETLFAKYVRGDQGEKGRFGLGLYFCSRVAAAHSGSVSVTDRAGWPVSFRFALPVR